MLKIIPTSIAYNETFLCKEMKLSLSLYDSFSSFTPQEIIEKVILLFKEERKTDKMMYDKLIFIVSLIIQSNTFDSNDKSKKLLRNIIEAVLLLKDISITNCFDDLLCLLPSSSYNNLKEYLFTILYSKDLNKKERKVIQFYFTHYSNDTTDKSIDDFVTYINNKHCYSLFSNLSFPVQLINRLRSFESINSMRVLFYLVITLMEVHKCNKSDLKQKMIAFQKELYNEIQLIDLIEKGDYNALVKFDFNKNLKEYNEEGIELISVNSKLAVFHSLISSIYKYKREIPFKELEIVTKLSFDSIEDILTEGNIKSLFNIKINYETETVKVFNVKQLSYSKENIDQLINDISSIRNKFGLVIKSISLI